MVDEVTLMCEDEDCGYKITMTQKKFDDLEDYPTCPKCKDYSMEEWEDEEMECDVCGDTLMDEGDKDKYVFFKYCQYEGQYSGLLICKKCIDKAYPRQATKVETKEIIKEVIKFVERKDEKLPSPPMFGLSNEKTRFDI